ncbi:PTS transporter subunit IIC [Teredinibacter haidensis]|uniref:PTS transporter subunit IIC n=1 Tax=Teredinibacter haidensis TaxID=2731755 RepID=UPI000948D364|nr:PTS transporter subunit IIC [Teredinibacter haidensis]
MLQSLLDTFFSFKAYVMLPIIIFMIALLVGLSLRKSFIAAVELAVGFAGVFIAFDFFVANIKPAVEQLSVMRGLDFPVLDVGWPPLAAITWASPIAAIAIPFVLVLNLALIAIGVTRTIYIDIWNYWHFAFLGALVMNISGSMAMGLLATAILAIYCFKLTEWTAPDVEREMGLKGVSASPVSVNGIVPYTALVNALIDRLPVLNKIEYNPEKNTDTDSDNPILALLSEPMVIGILMGLALAVAAGYDLKQSLELSVHIAAVMFILPKCAGLIGEAMVPITAALRSRVEKYFPHRTNLVVALDTGFLMSHKSVIVTGLILMACAIVIALILPGNKVLPLGDLPNLISVMSISVLMFRGNVFRAVLAGIPVIVTFLLVATELAPKYTALAAQTSAFNTDGMGLITAFTDGGHQVRYLLYSLFQGEWFAVILAALLLVAMWFTRRRWKALTKNGH